MKWEGSAEFSLCRTWRYTLERVFPDVPGKRRIAWLMLNPSTADEMKNDPTVNRTCIWSVRWGFHYSTVINMYAFRSPKPSAMWKVADPVGPLNDRCILDVVSRAELVICAWGTNIKPARQKHVIDMLLAAGEPPSKFRALVLTKAKIPGHPLYLKENPVPFEWLPQ